MLPPRELAALYRASRTVVFPMATIGGGERALLEAPSYPSPQNLASFRSPRLGSKPLPLICDLIFTIGFWVQNFLWRRTNAAWAA